MKNNENSTQILNRTPEGFLYVPEFLTNEEQIALMSNFKNLEYVHQMVRGNVMKRRYAQFGYAYKTSGKKILPAPSLPAYLSDLITKGLPFCPTGTNFNQCIITYYPPLAGFNFHVDEPYFSDCIIAVSLGSGARLQFAPKQIKKATFELLAKPGSLYVMHGKARWDYAHRVVPVKEDRYSITFRSYPNTPKNAENK